MYYYCRRDEKRSGDRSSITIIIINNINETILCVFFLLRRTEILPNIQELARRGNL